MGTLSSNSSDGQIQLAHFPREMYNTYVYAIHKCSSITSAVGRLSECQNGDLELTTTKEINSRAYEVIIKSRKIFVVIGIYFWGTGILSQGEVKGERKLPFLSRTRFMREEKEKREGSFRK